MKTNADSVSPLIPMRNLLDLKKDGVNYLTKWMVLDQPSKLKTITDAKLFASFPSNFNDSFDSQFRLSQEDKTTLAKDIKIKSDFQDFGHIIVGKNWTTESMLAEIELQIDKTHCTNIACFSSLDPLALESNHMWGLYANNGFGIALQYKIDAVWDFIKTNQEFANSCGFYDVIYSDNPNQTNSLNYLKTILRSVVIEKNISKAVNAWQTFYTVKSKEWQFEKEWRFISLRTQACIAEVLPDHKYEQDQRTAKQVFQMHRNDNRNAIFDFIKPDRIIFGWNNDENNEKQQEYSDQLKSWAKEPNNNIVCIELDKAVDYQKSLFMIRKES